MITNKSKKHYELIDREIEKSIIHFSESLMSNSKWVRLTEKLIDNVCTIKKIEFKKVQSAEIGELYLDEDTTFEFDYWQNGFEGNNSLGGWLTFKEIEYLTFPRIVAKESIKDQSLEKIKEVIDSVGEFVLDINEDRIKLICYR